MASAFCYVCMIMLSHPYRLESSQEIYLATCCACVGLSCVLCIAAVLAFSSSCQHTVWKVDKDLDGNERQDIDRSDRLPKRPGQPGRPGEVGPLVPLNVPTLLTLLPETRFQAFSTGTSPPGPINQLATTAHRTTTTSRPLSGLPFACTITVRRFRPMPRDGLCDVLFYDSLYQPQASKLPVDMETTAGQFIRTAQQMSRTRFGMSFAIESLEVEREYRTRSFDAGLNQLWQYKISHFGFLNAYLEHTSVDPIKRALNTLKKIHAHLLPKETPTRHVVTSLGVAPVNPLLFRTYGNLMQQIYIPQIFIAVGHLSYRDNVRADCVIMPPTIYKFPRGFTPTYGHTLIDSINLLRDVAKATTYPAPVLSFTMQARMYEALNVTKSGRAGSGSAGFSVFERYRSSPHSFSQPTSSCPSTRDRRWDNYRYITNLRASLTYNRQENLTMTFDSERALRVKACKSKELALELGYGLAAYSIDYDSSSKMCHELTLTGSYRRVAMLASTHAFITRRSSDSSPDYYAAICCACLGLTSVICIALFLALGTTMVNEDSELDGDEGEGNDESLEFPEQREPAPSSSTGTHGRTSSLRPPAKLTPLSRTESQRPLTLAKELAVSPTPESGATPTGHPQLVSSTASPSTPPSPRTTTAPTTSLPRRAVPFVCTVTTLSFTPLPQDGLCDVIFYDSLYKTGASNPGVDVQTLKRQFAHMAVVMSRTELGVSFAIESQELKSKYRTKEFDAHIGQLWRHNISHFGILNAYLDYTLLVHFTLALNVLKKVQEHLTSVQRPNRRMITAIGVAPVNPSLFSFYGQLLYIFVPDLFIAIGHLSYPDSVTSDCFIMPPTVLRFPQGFTPTYGHTLGAAVDLLRHINRAPTHPALALSFSMQARKYQPLVHTTSPKADDFGLFARCRASNDSFFKPASVCPSPGDRRWDNYRYNTAFHGSLTFNRIDQLTMTFDSGRALRSKVSETKESAPGIKFGLAVYAVDYDSSSKVCNELTLSGSYMRVAMLASLHDFITGRYNNKTVF